MSASLSATRSYFFFSSRRRHTRYWRDWSSDVCSSDLDVEWAEAFGWDVERTDVGSYFGRCLGAVAIAISGQALWASRDPARYRHLFDLLAAAGVLLAIVHLRGLVEESQPWIEHVETLAYAGFAALALWAKPR